MTIKDKLEQKLNKSPVHTAIVKRDQTFEVYSSKIDPNQYNKQEILQFIKSECSKTNGQTNTKLSCWQSSYHIHKETSLFDKLVTLVNSTVNDFFDLDYEYRLLVQESWAAVYKKGDYARLHGHGSFCNFSAVLYLQSNKEHSPLSFEDGFSLPCFEDTIYFFNSNYRHLVSPSQSDNLRIILGFNFICLDPYILKVYNENN
jgi:hypothetical protein